MRITHWERGYSSLLMEIWHNTTMEVHMKRFLIAFALLFAGCSGTDDDSGPETIRPGIYLAELQVGLNPLDKLSMESNFGADGTYRGRAFVSDGSATCLLLEGVASWTGDGDSYTLTTTTVKARSTCDAEFETEQVPGESTPIRNITAASFEEYVEWEDQPAQWVEFNKI